MSETIASLHICEGGEPEMERTGSTENERPTTSPAALSYLRKSDSSRSDCCRDRW